MIGRTILLGIAACCGTLATTVADAADSWQPFVPDNARVFDVRAYGAKGDGLANDTAAFQAAAKALTEAGGGTIDIPKGTYILGLQRHEDGKLPYYRSENPLMFTGINGLAIEGNGATLRWAPGLRFGSFDKNTGERFDPPKMPFIDFDYRVGIGSMISMTDCRNVVIRDLELDGNSGSAILGGEWGDTGRQLEGYGVCLYKNSNVLVENLYTHHHPLDGIIVGWTGLKVSDTPTPHLLRNIRSEYNARQGLSWVGGRGLTVRDSEFNFTQRGALGSAPGAGLDIEAEDSVCRDGLFINCRFIDNAGCAVVADSGDGGYTRFIDCVMWGTTNYSLWTRKPGIRYEQCAIYGTAVHGFGASDPALATQYIGCNFEDREYQERGVFLGAGLMESCGGDNILYEGCVFRANKTRGAWIDDANTREIIRHCTFIHAAPREDQDFVSLLRGCRVENTRFLENYPADNPSKYYIACEGVATGPGVRVSGSHVKWQNWSWGATGDIEQKKW